MTEAPDATPSGPPAADFDSPWKEAIDAYFRPFMALFFPTVHERINWTRPTNKRLSVVRAARSPGRSATPRAHDG